MSSWHQFIEKLAAGAGRETVEVSGGRVVADYGDVEGECRALRDGAALVDRSYRCLIEVRGKDRLSFLHNFTTNEVKNLRAGDGNYAFALNVKGRIEFDLNLTVMAESVWVDVDRCFLARALKHFGKYIITEDVQLADRTADSVRLALVGSAMAAVMTALGAPSAKAMAQLAPGSVAWNGMSIPFIRHDFCGLPAVELFVPADRAVEFWEAMTSRQQATANRQQVAGFTSVEIRRIEAGIPRSGVELHDDILPAETGQLDRAVSYQKGCYLGQEVVERMRSRGGLARKLVGLVVAGDEVPPPGAEFHADDGKTVGKLTSACRSFAMKSIIALGYAKVAAAAPGTRLHLAWDGGVAEAVVGALPFSHGT